MRYPYGSEMALGWPGGAGVMWQRAAQDRLTQSVTNDRVKTVLLSPEEMATLAVLAPTAQPPTPDPLMPCHTHNSGTMGNGRC